MLTRRDLARFAAVGAVTSFAAPSLAASVGDLTTPPLASSHVPRGACRRYSVFDAEILAGHLPPLVTAMLGARRSLYMDYHDGSQRWQASSSAMSFPSCGAPSMSRRAESGPMSVDCRWRGLGALRIAFKHPRMFAAVAALEPAVEATLTW